MSQLPDAQMEPGSELPLPLPWPANLRFEAQGTGWSQFANWLGTDDVCAVFDTERGGFLGTLRPGGQLTVRPGAVAVVSRCRFGITGLDTDLFLGGIHMAWASVEADLQVDFPFAQSALIRPRPDRRITLGPVMAQDTTGALLFGSAMTAAVSVPGELGAELTADLVIRHPALSTGEIRTSISVRDRFRRWADAAGHGGRLKATRLPGHDGCYVVFASAAPA